MGKLINLVWFRNDLRVDDNPALFHSMANASHGTVAVYMLCQQQWEIHSVGINQQALIIKALKNLCQELEQLNVPLLILDAKNFTQVPELMSSLCSSLSVKQLFFNIEYPVNERQRDKEVVDILSGQVDCIRSIGDSLVPPWKIVNGDGNGYKVFSAFARRVRVYLDQNPLVVLPVPKSKTKDNLQLVDDQHLSIELPTILPLVEVMPDISEKNVLQQLNNFVEYDVRAYGETRDIPSIAGTSNLSAAFAIGSVSVQRCFELAQQHAKKDATTWLNELIWRDFYRAVIWHYPDICRGQAFNKVDRAIRWANSNPALEAWQQGKTGIPIVDAAMKQLVTTGWMHNRLRMVVASYLTKNLFMDWRLGETFFAKHLFDYDFASNNGGWQWCASVGTDAAPYFRVFNPASQQKRFDPEAKFIKCWLPKISHHSAKDIQRFETHPLENYSAMQVDLKQTRRQAIEVFKIAKQS